MIKIQRTPQEKKRLNYENDRRNTYGENDKASRKGIRFRKRWVNQSFRSTVKQVLNKTFTVSEDIDVVNDKVKEVKRKDWKKEPDISLCEHLKRKRKF